MTDIQILENKATGWKADLLDERDKVKLLDVSVMPTSVDLREWCSDIESQGSIQSCTAHAAVTLVEYYQKRTTGKHLDASRLFLYKVTRNLLQYEDKEANATTTMKAKDICWPHIEDKGANPRTTLKALATFGVPEEKYWPYELRLLYEEPSAFCYALAQANKAQEYYRIDVKGISRDRVLQQIKANLAANRPLMFNFLLLDQCFEQANLNSGKIPFPTEDVYKQLQKSDSVRVGHSVAAVGYDDKITIKNTDPTGRETTGAILIKNCWGTEWGDSGYGWLPYEYVLQLLSSDWWTIVKQDWLQTGQFEAKS